MSSNVVEAEVVPVGCRKVRVLYKHEGENSDTAYSPIRELAEGETVPETLVTRCLNYDDNRLVEIHEFKELTRVLPEWLSVEEWVRRAVKFSYLWGYGCPKSFPEAWQRKLINFGQNEAYGAIKLLLTKKFRSEFRQSLRTQLESWLNAQGEQQYASPFSQRQWGCLLNQYVCREASATATDMYYHHRYHEL